MAAEVKEAAAEIVVAAEVLIITRQTQTQTVLQHHHRQATLLKAIKKAPDTVQMFQITPVPVTGRKVEERPIVVIPLSVGGSTLLHQGSEKLASSAPKIQIQNHY